MSEIPEDIRKAAYILLRNLRVWDHTEPDEADDKFDADQIARAIRAERERCEKIAVHASGHFVGKLVRLGPDASDHDVAVFESAISAANAIAVTIRTPTKQ